MERATLLRINRDEISVPPDGLTARLRRFFRLNAEKALIIGVTTAILQVYGAFRFGIASESDFGIFQGSTARFLDGARIGIVGSGTTLI